MGSFLLRLALAATSALAVSADGFTVCGAGLTEMNGFYELVTKSEYRHNQSTPLHQRLLYFDVSPPAGLQGPFAWELYTYALFRPPRTRYAISVDDFVDPPMRGWHIVSNTTAPAPTVLPGAQ